MTRLLDIAMPKRREIVVDSFAGGGGASVGIEAALGRPVDAALNHDPIALAIHRENHPRTRHICQDIWQAPPQWVCQGHPVGLLWASPDCTHFSKAKGSAPKRDAKIRDLAWAVVRWAEEVRPRVIILENVEEFQTWGPLDNDGAPIRERAGDTYNAWLRRLRRLGYSVQARELTACDYGAPTSRKRLFIVARCDGQPIVWPEPTYGPGRASPYRTAAECIDFSLPCPSIFESAEEIREKYGVRAVRPLAEKTMARIAEGVRRYVLEAEEPFIVSYYNGSDFRGQDINEPLRTISTENRFGLVMPSIMTNTSGHAPTGISDTLSKVTTGNHHSLIMPFLEQQNSRSNPRPVDAPLGTAMARDHHALVTAFLAKHFGGVVGHEVTRPIGTITGIDHHSLVASNLVKFKGTARHGQDARAPLHTIQSGGNHYGEVRAFLLKYYGTATGQGVADPLHTVTSKDRMGLVTVMVQGQPYVIADIGMRMLTVDELKLAQGFPASYRLDVEFNGRPLAQKYQKRAIGNSVSPPMAQALAAANCPDLILSAAA